MGEKSDIKGSLTKMKEILGQNIEITEKTFTNWAENQKVQVLSVSPNDVEEVKSVILAARKVGLRVRAVGTGHTWSPLFSDEGNVIVHVRNLKRPNGEPNIVLSTNPDDPCTKLLTVATGVTAKELMQFQLDTGFCLPSNVILREVQLGGVVSPACHGVGWDQKSVSDNIVSMRIIDSQGELRTYSMKDCDHMIRAVQCNLGLWGIIVDLTLKVEPMIMVETKNVWIKVKDLFYNQDSFKKIIHDNWSVELFWYPFNSISTENAFRAILSGRVPEEDWDPKEDEVQVRIINKLDKSPAPEPSVDYCIADFKEFVQALGFKMIENTIDMIPQIAPLFLMTQTQVLKEQFPAKLIQQIPHAIHFRAGINEVPVYDMEWGFRVDQEIENVCKATQGTVNMVREAAAKGEFPMNLPLEMRFLAYSDAYMAPYSNSNPKYGGTGHTCQIEVLTTAGTPGWKEFCQEVANVWQGLPGARPHWCKEWSFLTDIREFIRESYKDMIPKFLSALQTSGADPHGMFFNDTLEQLLYPNGHPGKAGQ